MTGTLIEAERDLSDYAGRPLRARYEGYSDQAVGALAIATEEEPEAYVVEEDTTEPFPGRQWLVAKQGGDNAVYRVECGRDTAWHCSCLGFGSASRAADAEVARVRRTLPWAGRIAPACKHTIAMRWLLDAGHLDPAPPPAHDTPTDAELDRMFELLGVG